MPIVIKSEFADGEFKHLYLRPFYGICSDEDIEHAFAQLQHLCCVTSMQCGDPEAFCSRVTDCTSQHCKDMLLEAIDNGYEEASREF